MAWHRAGAATTEPAPYADGQIAAIAYVNELTLVTVNVKDFARFKGVEVENWSKRRGQGASRSPAQRTGGSAARTSGALPSSIACGTAAACYLHQAEEGFPPFHQRNHRAPRALSIGQPFVRRSLARRQCEDAQSPVRRS